MRRALPLQRLPPGVDPLRGLSGEEIPARAERYGPNAIVERVRRPWRDLVRDTARDPMIWFLVGTSAVYFALGAARDAAGLLIAIVPLIGMDAWLHRRTQASLAALAGQLSRKARVVRDGALAEVDARDLVVGDLAVIGAGEPFPADGIVLSGAELQSDESALTGESWPVRKRPLDPSTLSGTAPMVEGDHWVYAGTRLLTGEARIRVVFTGEETTYGEIVRLAQKGSGGRTPLQSAVGGLVSILVVAAGLLCVALALVRWTQGHGVVDALVSAATLAVAALPEEFPVALTFFLGAGAYRLARRRALVRRAVTVENIGRVSVICSDKTGTLTEGRLALADLVPHAVEERELLRVAALASRPEAKDPLDTVLTESARRQGIPLSHDAVAIFPFTEDRRRETAVLSAGAGRLECVTKGAPEVILSLSTLDPAERAIWSERVSELAARGRKVVAVARQPLEPGAWRCGEPLSGYELLGLVGCADPIREGVPEAIAACRAGGIHVLMVTGDHPVTARAVARELGLGGRTPRIATGEELDGLLQSGDGVALRKLDVIARALPAQKLAIVRALQRAGELVAVTGDGVNDVPALEAADVGVAMGERGNRTAQDVASIILLDDNFRSIAAAIAEGRQLFANLQASFQYLLLIHIPLVLSAAFIPLAGYPLLYLPIHIVLLELVIHPTALLAFQSTAGPLQIPRERRTREVHLFGRAEWVRVLMGGGLATALVMAAYPWSIGATGDPQHARAMSLAVLLFSGAGFAAALSRLRTRLSRAIVIATLAAALAIIAVGPIARVLQLSPLRPHELLIAGLAAVVSALPLLAALTRPRTSGASECRPGPRSTPPGGRPRPRAGR